MDSLKLLMKMEQSFLWQDSMELKMLFWISNMEKSTYE